MNEKVKKIVKWIAVIAAAIGAAAAVIMEQGCTHKHLLKVETIEQYKEYVDAVKYWQSIKKYDGKRKKGNM